MKWLSALLAGLALLAVTDEGKAVQGRRPQSVVIGVVKDGPYDRYTDILEIFRKEVVDLLSGDFEADLPSAKRIEADWTLAGIEAAIDSLFADPEVDMIITLGPISSHLVSHRTDLPKPVVAPIVIDRAVQGLPHAEGGSGVHNLNYVALPDREDLPVFLEIVSFERVAILANASFVEALPQVVRRAVDLAAEIGLEAEVIPVSSPMDDALFQQLDRFEAVYVLPLTQVTEAEFQRLVQALIDRRLPSFSWMGQREVNEGILAGRTPIEFPERLARRAALNIQRILLGEEASTLPVAFSARDRLTINMATARAIGVFPRWKVVTEALLIEDQARPMARVLSLSGAVEEAVIANLDLAVQDRVVAAGAQDIKLATADLLPQIGLSVDASVIDEDRAAASFGSNPERLFTGTAALTQVIYAEPVWANRSIQKSVQEARTYDRRSVEIDISFDAAVTYLNVLSAKTFERIQKENLQVTRTNLELAQVREFIGSASAGEVYRWEAQIAGNRQAVINASAQRNLAEIELNRLLNRPLEEYFDTREAQIEDPSLLSGRGRLYSYMDNQWSFRVFRQFMAQEALQHSPVLKVVESLTKAQARALSSTKRSFWQPTIVVEAGITDIFSKSGAGSTPGFGVELPGGIEVPGIDDFVWSVGVNISYPLFVGGSRVAERNQASEDLARLNVERDALAQRVEQRVRSALHEMGASGANIDLSRDAAEASRNNFNLVSDSYARGAVSIIDLIDAQNAALVSEEQAANAVYDFLIDLMKVERAVGRFSFFMTDQQREAFFQRADDFFQQAGGPPIER